MPYYNTNKEEGPVLAASNVRVNNQEAKILDFFKLYPGRVFARRDIEYEFSLTTQSCSRALRNLTKRGALTKRGKLDMVMGDFGKKVHVWGLPVKPRGQMEMF